MDVAVAEEALDAPEARGVADSAAGLVGAEPDDDALGGEDAEPAIVNVVCCEIGCPSALTTLNTTE